MQQPDGRWWAWQCAAPVSPVPTVLTATSYHPLCVVVRTCFRCAAGRAGKKGSSGRNARKSAPAALKGRRQRRARRRRWQISSRDSMAAAAAKAQQALHCTGGRQAAGCASAALLVMVCRPIAAAATTHGTVPLALNASNTCSPSPHAAHCLPLHAALTSPWSCGGVTLPSARQSQKGRAESGGARTNGASDGGRAGPARQKRTSDRT